MANVTSESGTCLEHMRLPPVASRIHVSRYIIVRVDFHKIVCPFVFFPLAIMLYVLLRFTDLYYPYDITRHSGFSRKTKGTQPHLLVSCFVI
jgi:hypothetical protein